MLNRLTGIAAAILMIVANAAIIWRDIVPAWRAGDPPPSEAQLLAAGEERRVQVGIFDDNGQTIGRSWTRSRHTGVGGLVNVQTATALEPIHLPGGIRTPRVLIRTDITFRNHKTRIDTLDFKMLGLGLPISLHGEAMETGEFPFTWQVGTERGNSVLDSAVPAALGDVIRPFDRLPDLYVGRSWKLKLLDPLAHLLPNAEAAGLDLEPVLIQVTGKEMITHGGERIETFVVEGGGVTAWVAADGRVLRQEANLPLVGKLILLDEPYDEDAYAEALRTAPAESERRVRNNVEGPPP